MHCTECFCGSFIRSWGGMSEKLFMPVLWSKYKNDFQKNMESTELLRTIIMKIVEAWEYISDIEEERFLYFNEDIYILNSMV